MYEPINVQLFLEWPQQDAQHRLRSEHGLLRNKQAYTISPGLRTISEKTEVKAVDQRSES